MKLKLPLSASLLLACLAASPAAARQEPVEFRQGDAFRGPVRTARIEHAAYSRVNGVLVEGPRRLSVVTSYTPDGRRKEYEGYAPDGALRTRYVFVYDAAGREIEKSVYDGAGNLQARVVQRPEAGETLTYGADGALRERRVASRRADGTQAETRVYDGGGALKERSVNVRENGVSVWSTYRADGTLKNQTTHTLDYGGAHRSEELTFAPDGSAVGRRVGESDAAATDLRAVNEGHNPGPRKTRETREYDSRRNLSKLTSYVWNEATNEYEPSYVTYYTVAYYR